MTSNPFHIVGGGAVPPAGAPFDGDDRSAPPAARVGRMVSSSDVFLFMKGTPRQPLCGFSANTVAILEHLGVPYATFDVLSDEAIRAGAKEFAQWPTFPQLYVRGEFVGGNDIVTEMHHTGELGELVRGGGA